MRTFARMPPLDEIDAYVRQSGRGWIDVWLTKWTFRQILLKRAYTKDEFIQIANQSRFGTARINVVPIGFGGRFAKPLG